MSARPYEVSADLETAEREWWERFAEVENRYCWVQTKPIQRAIRGHYLRKIIAATKPEGSILELGCGVGWLCILLAEMGAKNVIGVDFSPAQIQLAQQAALSSEARSSVKFECADGTKTELQVSKFDTVVVHGFLHHLSTKEIEGTLRGIPSLLNERGLFIVFEPVQRDGWNEESGRWMRRLQRLKNAANRGKRLGVRRFSDSERELRTTIAERGKGVPPHGPSPKEMPFAPGELEGLLSKDFVIEERTSCMAQAHIVVQEWLLRGVSHPLSTGAALPVIAKVASALDRAMLRNVREPAGMWTFDMFLCRKK